MTGVPGEELTLDLTLGWRGQPPMGPLVPSPPPRIGDRFQRACGLVLRVWRRCHRIGAPSSVVVVLTPVLWVVSVCVRRSKFLAPQRHKLCKGV